MHKQVKVGSIENKKKQSKWINENINYEKKLMSKWFLKNMIEDTLKIINWII